MSNYKNEYILKLKFILNDTIKPCDLLWSHGLIFGIKTSKKVSTFNFYM